MRKNQALNSKNHKRFAHVLRCVAGVNHLRISYYMGGAELFSASGSIYSFNGFSRRNILWILLRHCLRTPLCTTIRSGLQTLCLWRR